MGLATGWRLLKLHEVVRSGDRCTSEGGYQRSTNPLRWIECESTVGKTVAVASRGVLKYFARQEQEPPPVEKEWMNPWD